MYKTLSNQATHRTTTTTITPRTCRRRAFISKENFLLLLFTKFFGGIFLSLACSHTQLSRPMSLGCITSWNADGEVNIRRMMFHPVVIEHEMEQFSGVIESVISISFWTSHRTRNIHSSTLKILESKQKIGSRARSAPVVSRHWITRSIFIEFRNPGELWAPELANDIKR